MRAIRAGITLTAGALALSGCAVFDGTPTAAQLKTIGPVVVHFTVCASHTSSSPPVGSCSNKGNSGATPGTYPSQVFLAFRVPHGTVAPGKFSSTGTGPSNTGPQLVFMPSQSYTAELQRLKPAAKGEEWVGYVSQWVNYNSASGDQYFTDTVHFGLPKGKNGAPFAGPFKYQLVVGGRQYVQSSGGPPPPAASESVDCFTSLTHQLVGEDGKTGKSSYGWVCVDDQSPSTLGSDAALATRDAGIVPGKQASASPGSKAHVRFTFKYAGTSPGASFKLKAATALHGAKATASPAKIKPTHTSSKHVKVTVKVPAGAKAGIYKVKLTAKLPDGESRTGTGTLRVK